MSASNIVTNWSKETRKANSFRTPKAPDELIRGCSWRWGHL